MATDLRQQFERDIVEALKRQAVAYQENFDHQVDVLKSEYERRIQQQDKIFEAERVVELQAKYNQASAALAAIEQGIECKLNLVINKNPPFLKSIFFPTSPSRNERQVSKASKIMVHMQYFVQSSQLRSVLWGSGFLLQLRNYKQSRYDTRF